MSAATTVLPSARLGGHTGDHRRSRPVIALLAGFVSAVYVVMGGVWTFVPSTNVFADPESMLSRDTSLLLSVLGPGSTARALLALSLAGVVVAAVAVVAGNRDMPYANGIVAGFGVVFALVVGLGLLSEVAISMAGYLMALVVAVGALVLGVQIVRTSLIGRWLVMGIVGALVAVFAADVLPVSARGELGGLIAELRGELAAIALVLGLVVGALLWALAGGLAMRDTVILDRAASWVLRHRRTITVLASLGPLPYALLRLSWLTPWPLLAPEGDLAAEYRIWGLMLSTGAWAGFILTIGLIRPWGGIFPRWMPRLAGRPVPVWCAAGPGAVVARSE